MIPYQICIRPTSQVCACVCVLSNYTSGSQVNTNRLLLSTSGMHMSFDRAPHSSGWWLGKTTPNSKGHGIHSLGAVTCSSPSMSTSALQWTTKCIEHVPNELNATASLKMVHLPTHCAYQEWHRWYTPSYEVILSFPSPNSLQIYNTLQPSRVTLL